MEIEKVESGAADVQPVGPMCQQALPLSLKDSVLRLSVNRKYVEVQTEIIVKTSSLQAFGTGVLNLGEKMDKTVPLHPFLVAKASVTRVWILAEGRDKAFIIRTWHQQVNVIVPRDEAFVAHRSEKGSVSHRIPDPFLRAESVDSLQDVQEVELNLSM